MFFFQVRAEAQTRSHMRSMSQSAYQAHHPDNSAMNALYGCNTSPRRLAQQQYLSQGSKSVDSGKPKKNSPFKDRFKLPNFSKFLDKAFGDDSRKTYQQYSHSTMSAPTNTPKRNLARRSMSHSGQHSYSSQPHTHFATSKRYSTAGAPVSTGKERAPLPPDPVSAGGAAPGRERWSLCQCDPNAAGIYPADVLTLSPKMGGGRAPSTCPKPTPSPRYSIHRYPLGMHNTHDDVTGTYPMAFIFFFTFWFRVNISLFVEFSFVVDVLREDSQRCSLKQNLSLCNSPFKAHRVRHGNPLSAVLFYKKEKAQASKFNFRKPQRYVEFWMLGVLIVDARFT